jgi:hypothetical protein
MIVEIKMISIGTTKITPKNRSELVFFGCMDRKRPVLSGPVRSPQYLGRSWTGCGPRLRVLGAKNRTEPDLKTLLRTVNTYLRANESLFTTDARKIDFALSYMITGRTFYRHLYELRRSIRLRTDLETVCRTLKYDI